MEKHNIMDPYKILQVKQNYTYDQLRSNYKRLVLEYHPDRSSDINKSPIFQTLKFAYDFLINELKAKQSDKSHFELKTAAKSGGGSTSGTNNNFIPGDKFNVERFNKLFSESRIAEVYDDGYGKWTEDSPKQPNALVNYKEPNALMGGRFASAYELGNSKVDDYSGDNMGPGLQFMDYRLAHTTTLLVDEKAVDSRPEFKSVEELKKHRTNMSLIPTADDVKKRHLQKMEDEKRESDRQKALKEKDSLIETIYKKSHKLMLAAFS